jgi:hypothetical protein
MRSLTHLLRVLVIVFALFAVVNDHSHAQSAPQTTVICSSITTDTTWTLASSPYEICNTAGLVIQQGATLTIQPGVTVEFDGAGYPLTIQGAVNALGTATQPITITGMTKSPGSWRGLLVAGTGNVKAALNLDYTTVQYGGGAMTAEIYADLADVSINHSQIQSSLKNGLELTNRAGFTLQNTAFTGNAQDAVTVHEPKTDLALSGLSASGNGQNAVHIAGLNTQMHGQRRWANPGLPYLVDGSVNNAPGDVLTLAPGSELQFNGGSLNIAGQLSAIGLPAQPITLTGAAQSPGAWRGLTINGGTSTASAQLDYVAIEYGGSDIGGADIYVVHGALVTHHTLIRSSLHDGVRFDNDFSGSLLAGQITGNLEYGVRNMQPVNGVLASNNWWGDANGPQSDTAGCSTGMGNPVSTGVFFRPVLTDTNLSVPFPLSNIPSISLTPERWFAAANGITRVYFDIQVLDGNGAPLLGRQVRLSSTLGSVVDGGITDASGKTLAYLTSGTPGDAQVTARLDPITACEGALSPTAKVTFTPPLNLTDLFPNSQAPYLSSDISVTPMPVISGITETIHALLTNPLTQTITVDVDFGYAQAGLGLAFGPIGSGIRGLVIPAGRSAPLTADFIPPISGHYCVQVSYTITAIGALALEKPMSGGGSGLKQFNMNVQQGSASPPNSKDSLNKADKAFKAVNKIPAGPTQIQKAMVGGWWGAVKDAATKISQSLGFDPPRQDYKTVTFPVRHPFPPVQPGGAISADRAAAFNAVSDSLTDIEAYGTAASAAFDRYAGASQANDVFWASSQSNEMLYYEQKLGTALVTYADHLDALVGVLQSEGETQTGISVSDVTAYQARLQTTGFTAQEIADAKYIGLTDADIEAWRQEIIAANPADIAGDLLVKYSQEAATMREVGNTILHPVLFNPGFAVGGAPGLAPQASGNAMAQVFNTTTTIWVGNPLTQTATIDLKARRIGLPADWSAALSPAQVTLAPGQQVTVTVTIQAGTPVAQGSRPSLAVEGYAGSQLLGGVVVQVFVPNYLPFDGAIPLYLPLVKK